jgi:hypothetical protein
LVKISQKNTKGAIMVVEDLKNPNFRTRKQELPEEIHQNSRKSERHHGTPKFTHTSHCRRAGLGGSMSL